MNLNYDVYGSQSQQLSPANFICCCLELNTVRLGVKRRFWAKQLRVQNSAFCGRSEFNISIFLVNLINWYSCDPRCALPPPLPPPSSISASFCGYLKLHESEVGRSGVTENRTGKDWNFKVARRTTELPLLMENVDDETYLYTYNSLYIFMFVRNWCKTQIVSC